MGALAVPLVALVIVTALEVYQSADEVRDVRDQTSLAEASIGPASLLSRLEDERNAAGVYMLNAQDAFALGFRQWRTFLVEGQAFDPGGNGLELTQARVGDPSAPGQAE